MLVVIQSCWKPTLLHLPSCQRWSQKSASSEMLPKCLSLHRFEHVYFGVIKNDLLYASSIFQCGWSPLYFFNLSIRPAWTSHRIYLHRCMSAQVPEKFHAQMWSPTNRYYCGSHDEISKQSSDENAPKIHHKLLGEISPGGLRTKRFFP